MSIAETAYDPITSTAQVALWVGCFVFALQASIHWCRTGCVASRARQHELLSTSTAACAALFYFGMANGISEASYATAGQRSRLYYSFLYLERGLCVGLLFLNTSTLARERRPTMVALGVLWLLSTAALYMGNAVVGTRRLGFLVASILCLLPVATVLVCAMGERVKMSQLQTIYRFLSAWCILCCSGYVIVYTLCEVAYILDTETEILVYMLLDFCTTGISSVIISCAGSDLEAGLLPAQEAELSLYPGPHNYGFYPNPDFYNDNL